MKEVDFYEDSELQGTFGRSASVKRGADGVRREIGVPVI